GWASFPGRFGYEYRHAVLWSGTAGSWINLNPPNSSFSQVYAIGGTQQAGSVDLHAAIWSGTATSFVDLTPAGSEWAEVYATTGPRQAGFALRQDYHAAIWSGTAASWVDLHPPVADVSQSVLFATIGSHQAGFAKFGDVNFGVEHASIWSG